MNWEKLGDDFEYANPIQYNQEYRQVEMEKKVQGSEKDDEDESTQWDEDHWDNDGTIGYYKVIAVFLFPESHCEYLFVRYALGR